MNDMVFPLAGGMTRRRNDIKLSGNYVRTSMCRYPYLITLFVGSIVNVVSYTLTLTCGFDAYGFTIAYYINIGSLCSIIIYTSFLVVKGFHKKKRNQQVICVNVTGFFAHSSLAFFLMYRFFFKVNKYLCLIGFQSFSVAGNLFNFSIVGLSLDCAIAVFKPLRYRVIVTKKRLLTCVCCLLIFCFITFFMYPLIAYGPMHDGILLSDCYLPRLLPKNYIIISSAFTVIMYVMIVFLNISICICVLVSFTQRKKLSNGNQSVVRSIQKLVARLGVTIVLNVGCGLPLITLVLGFYTDPQSIGFISMSALGIINNLFFFLSDSKSKEAIFRRS